MRAYAVVLIALVTSLVVSAATTFAVNRLGWLGPAQAQKIAVPHLLELNEEDARNNLSAIGLGMMVEAREPHESAKPGTVLRQSPPAGWLAEAGQAVNLTFAAVSPQVPSVLGKSKAEAEQLLKQAGFTVQLGDEVPSAEHAVGTIAAQSPTGGTPLRAGSAVVVRPSSGPAEQEVPKLLGLGIQQAKEAAEKAGMELVVHWVERAETNSYVVLSQKPLPGEKVEPGTQVIAVVNRGDE
jgi:beta-lactam-binding protein with PASTA domain